MGRQPTHNLLNFLSAIQRNKVNYTGTSVRNARSLGYSQEDMQDALNTLKPGHFYKSMESEQRPGLWQDVYHLPHNGRILYVKFRDDLVTDFMVLSFKEK